MNLFGQKQARRIAIALVAVGLLLLLPSLARASGVIRSVPELAPVIVESDAFYPQNLAAQTGLNSPRDGVYRVGMSEGVVPPPQKDPCLHCHIAGENKGLWTPLARWSLFGMLGLIFVFGVVRSASVWTTRQPWKPLGRRSFDWFDQRYEVSDGLSKVLKKPVPLFAVRWFYCLGGITAFLFITQAVTGIMLAFYYKPTPESAFASIQFIEEQVRFGAAIRAVHHWAANGMIVMCIAHMLRVFIMGAFKNPRELNWVSGVVLLILTLAFGFTGYLLPWDQRAFWATTVGTEIAGSIPIIGNLALVFLRVGWDVSGETLSRFYALHVIALPIFTLGLMGAHFLMVRRLGIARPL